MIEILYFGEDREPTVYQSDYIGDSVRIEQKSGEFHITDIEKFTPPVESGEVEKSYYVSSFYKLSSEEITRAIRLKNVKPI